MSQVGGAETSQDGVETSQVDENQANEQQQEVREQEKTVKWDDHNRALEDLHKYKKSVKTLQEELESLKTEKLKEQNNWKELYERERSQKDEINQKYSGLKDSIFTDKKVSAVRAAAARMGLRSEAEADLELLSLDGVQTEATSEGRILVHGADSFVEELKKNKPHWFKSKDVPNINTGGGNRPPETNVELTAAYMVQLERKDPQKYRELLPKYLKQRSEAMRR